METYRYPHNACGLCWMKVFGSVSSHVQGRTRDACNHPSSVEVNCVSVSGSNRAIRTSVWPLDGRAVVRGKILGQKQVATAYAKNYLAETLGEAHSTLCKSLERVETVETLDELRGVEGAASRAYFDLFRRCNHSDMSFEGRHKRGATDPINALLNFGYTLLTRELEGFLEAAGLDPTIGF